MTEYRRINIWFIAKTDPGITGFRLFPTIYSVFPALYGNFATTHENIKETLKSEELYTLKFEQVHVFEKIRVKSLNCRIKCIL